MDALRDVYDPEIPVNIVDLGLVYGVDIDASNQVYVEMTLTAAGCGMGPFIAQNAEWAITELEGVEEAHVEVVFDPPWTPERITEEAASSLAWTTSNHPRQPTDSRSSFRSLPRRAPCPATAALWRP